MTQPRIFHAFLAAAALIQPLSAADAPTTRPPVGKRHFQSDAVESFIQKVKSGIADPETARTFENCFPNTLDTTVFYSEENGVPDTYIITGDIDAMWLRDSSAQVNHYMAILGGAILPPIQGFMADHAGIQLSFIVPMLAYAYVAYYGAIGHRVGRAASNEPATDTP
ncbi:MAG: glycoside hydrolase family 125 protein [Akkermansiaceae bacterium]|nr:glycoside hydrolase family 125 protein [Akkermansiaceae bacterium]